MTIRHTLTAVSMAAMATALAAAPAAAQDAPGATAELMNADGENVGTVEATETPNGLIVHLEATGLPAGGHGFHIHATGQCDAPDFKSAGGHFNPDDSSHGFMSENGPHAGDMPNIFVGDDGTAEVDVFVNGVSISDGDMALLDDDGAAFMVHSGTDDYMSDPAGDAGNRIACGVVKTAGQ